MAPARIPALPPQRRLPRSVHSSKGDRGWPLLSRCVHRRRSDAGAARANRAGPARVFIRPRLKELQAIAVGLVGVEATHRKNPSVRTRRSRHQGRRGPRAGPSLTVRPLFTTPGSITRASTSACNASQPTAQQPSRSANRQAARRAEQRIGKQWDGRDVQTGLGRHPSDTRIGHALRNQDRPDNQRSTQITGPPSPLAPTDAANHRHEPLRSRRGRRMRTSAHDSLQTRSWRAPLAAGEGISA